MEKIKLEKGKQYLLVLPNTFPAREAKAFSKQLKESGFSDSLIVLVDKPSEVKVIEKEVNKQYNRLSLERQTVIHRICYHLEDTLNTRIVNWGKQGAAIKAMMKASYTEGEIKRVITYMAKNDDFFSDKGFDMTTVSNQIGRYRAMYAKKN